jgi:hypothetical protein
MRLPHLAETAVFSRAHNQARMKGAARDNQ